jgi:aspartyl-tRNA(Asn)/glutamyl-tRNA(Gln) amidotransferase subunit A
MTIPLTAADAAVALRAGHVTSLQLTEEMLRRADVIDPAIGAYVTRFDKDALAAAERADNDFARGRDAGPYQGIPIAIKDILATAEGPTTANSLVLDRAWGEGKDAPVISRLRAAGAVITGKTGTMEFAIGLPEAEKPFPISRNPWDLDHWPGGSSAGTGAGVSAGLFYAGIGTDTGGSIRIPAAFCGTSGLMPTYGLVPKSGCVPLGYSLDRVGVLARSVRDCATFLRIIAGRHDSDESSVERAPEDYAAALSGDLRGVRIGFDESLRNPEGADPALAARFDDAIEVLRSLGAFIAPIEIPYYTEVGIAQLVTMVGEALAYHRGDLGRVWESYTAGARNLIALGALVSASDFVQAQRVRRLGQRLLADLFTSVDLVVTPTASIAAPTFDVLDPERTAEVLAFVNTNYWNATGNPVLALPMGANEQGLPLSLQVAGRPFEDALVCRAGDAYQRMTNWHSRQPPATVPQEAGAP